MDSGPYAVQMTKKVITESSNPATCEACAGLSVTRPRALCDAHKAMRKRLQNRVAVRRARAQSGGRGIRSVTLKPAVALDLWDRGRRLAYFEAMLRDALTAQRLLDRPQLIELLNTLTQQRQHLLSALDDVRADLAEEAVLNPATRARVQPEPADKKAYQAARQSKFHADLERIVTAERTRAGG